MASTKTKRQPAHLEMVGGKGSRQRAWDAIRELPGAFTLNQLSRKTKIEPDTLQTYLKSLELAKYLRAEVEREVTMTQEKRWTLIQDVGIEAPRLTKGGKPVTQGLGTETMWRTMRIIGNFNASDLVAHAARGGVKVTLDTAKSYVSALHHAGYLNLESPARATGFGKPALQARYSLPQHKYTGPRPPKIQRSKSVYDPNLDKVMATIKEKDDGDL
jgi:DNA-binding HxlR family transcriptional regulator